MTDVELIEILESPRSNLEKALAIRAALKAAAPSALNIKPKTERKKREAKQPKLSPVERIAQLQQAANGAGHVDNERIS